MDAKTYLALVHDLPCVLCAARDMSQQTKTTAHHVHHGNGMGQRAADWNVCALCYDCHQGPQGLHGNRQRFRQAKWDEMDALAATTEAMWKAHG